MRWTLCFHYQFNKFIKKLLTFVVIEKMVKLVLYILGFFFIFRLITRLIFPVVKASADLKNTIAEIKRHQNINISNNKENPISQKNNKNIEKDDYIDYEEVKK